MSSDGLVVLKAQDLDGYLTAADKELIAQAENLYARSLDIFPRIERPSSPAALESDRAALVQLSEDMGGLLKEACAREKGLRVYPFVTPDRDHGEASRLIAKLREESTGHDEFVYYTQRAYELLFNEAWGRAASAAKQERIVRTPVSFPVRNFAVHRIPDLDGALSGVVMCVMLRGALLPSMIVSKEIQEYSSSGRVTPFALFRIRRNDRRGESDMEYILDLNRSYFDPGALDGKDLVFADPMNATGGSLVAVLRHLEDLGVRPRSVFCLNVIAALKGALRCVRAVEGLVVHTLWMDPVLNAKAYIMPGLGDAGDRINGSDGEDAPREIIRLIADYGAGIAGLYRAQIAAIEAAVLRR